MQQKIPLILHQTWKNDAIPPRWQKMVSSVKRFHPNWEYRLWTDKDIDVYVKKNHPDFYPKFAAYKRPIMRADAIRYILMLDFGGVYCDLDYEFLRPYDYGTDELLLATEFDKKDGDNINQVANYFFASTPGHPLWRDILDELMNGDMSNFREHQVVDLTGPGLVSRVFFRNREKYTGVTVADRLIFNPYRIHGSKERKILLNNGITVGLHHGSGSWKERYSLRYWKTKMKRLLKYTEHGVSSAR